MRVAEKRKSQTRSIGWKLHEKKTVEKKNATLWKKQKKTGKKKMIKQQQKKKKKTHNKRTEKNKKKKQTMDLKEKSARYETDTIRASAAKKRTHT